MTNTDIENKQLVLISYLKSIVGKDWKIKAEYQTNDNDLKVIVVQETPGQKIVFFDEDTKPLFNYYMIDIYGDSIQEEKNMSLMLGDLIGKDVIVEYNNEKWQIIFMQFSNFRAIEYMDIRRVGYNSTFKCIVNKIYEEVEIE